MRELSKDEAFRTSGIPVRDIEIIPEFSGAPERLGVWLIFGNETDAEAAQAIRDSLRRRAIVRLKQAGYPETALKSFQLSVTSFPEIERGGGRYSFFR